MRFLIYFLAAVAVVLALALPAAASNRTYVSPTTAVCNNGVTVNVSGGIVGLVLYFLAHPTAKLGACAAPAAVPSEIVHADAAVWECNAYNGLFLSLASHVATDLKTPGLRLAYRFLTGTPSTTFNTNPAPNGKGYFGCVLPGGAKVMPNVLADANGGLFPSPPYTAEYSLYPAVA